jgi:hypothetical protein
MRAEFATLKRLEALVAAAEGVFPGAASAKEMDPAATADAIAAEGEAAENAQVGFCEGLGFVATAAFMHAHDCAGRFWVTHVCTQRMHVHEEAGTDGWCALLLPVQAAKTAAEATETAAGEAEAAAAKSDALEATSKAAVAAWRASQVRPLLLLRCSWLLI